MKKILIIVIFISIPLIARAVIYGSGTSSDPYYGTLTDALQWSNVSPHFSTVYVGTATNNDLTIGSGGHLTIDPGITVIFTQLKSDLIITGSGILTAEGNSSNLITFTKASGNTHWGHISFETPGTNTPISGTGSFKYCVVEYGYAITSGQMPDNGGGAIQINAKGVTIENCTFSYNKGSYGGAVGVNSSMDAFLKNCLFLSNNAPIAGGAMLIRNLTTSVVENCIFDQNTCDGTGSSIYSGGAVWTYSNSSKIINSTFYLNTTKPDYTGDAVYSYNSPGSSIINSIFWGSDDQVAYYGTSPSISYSAFETSKPSSATNSIIITGTAGNHFTDPSGVDFSLRFDTPCRDAGTTPSPAVPDDYVGNPRVYNYDMGAYEYQYSRWKESAGSTDWNTSSNWYGELPSGSKDVLIPTGASNYPTVSPGPDFTIGAGKIMTIEQGAKVTLHDFINNGILRLNHAQNTSGFTSLILNSYTRGGTGSEEIQLFLAGGGSALLENYKWHYISTPVSSVSTNVFTGVTLDLAQYIESRVSTSLLQGWVAYDGYVYSTGLTNGPVFNTLTPGKGYDFWDNNDNTFTFGGLLNTSDVTMSLSYSGAPTTMHGFNLLGNPFPSGLNWDDITNSLYFTYPANTSKGLYFTRDNVQCSYIGGVGIPADVTGTIPPMQGFFVKTGSTGNSITLPAAARTHTNIHARYKGSYEIPLVRLALFKDTISEDETVVRFDAFAKSDLDNDFDAVKMFISSSSPSLYSASDGVSYAINGLPFPESGSTTEIPLVANFTSDGTHKISATQLQGLDAYDVMLTDNVTGFTADLKTSAEITFTASAGTVTDRYILKVGNITTGVEKPLVKPGVFLIYNAYGAINIRPLADEWNNMNGSVRILDLAGRTLSDLENVEFNVNSEIKLNAPGVKGIYVVDIRAGIRRFAGKVAVK